MQGPSSWGEGTSVNMDIFLRPLRQEKDPAVGVLFQMLIGSVLRPRFSVL